MPRRLGPTRAWPVPVPVLALGVLLVAGVVLEAIHELTVHPGSSPAGPFFDDWLHDCLIFISAGVAAAGAARHTRDGRAWTCIAIALLCIGLGEITWDLLYTNVSASAIPYPNLADVFDLASYPLLLAGLILIIRRRVPRIELHRWLDGIVIVLVVATPMVALVLRPVLRNAPPDLVGQIVTLTYPLGDLLLIGTLLGALPMMSWRVDVSWLLLGGGLLCLTVGDATYAAAAVDATYHNGRFDFLWSAGSVAIAWAAWSPTAETQPPAEVFGWRAILLPLGAQLFAVGTQVFGYFVDLPPSERLLTIAILSIGAAQIVISRPRPSRRTTRTIDLAASERTWEAHTAAEFVLADVDATMATMTANPVVVHVATSVGARGREAVRRFYADHFVGHQAPDMQLVLTSRTATPQRVVDEMTISFTHDAPIPWILPGVAPTGRKVVVPIVAVIGMREGLVDSEHIYWDQATVLAQVGLLDPTGLPITGAEQAGALSAHPGAHALNALLAQPGSPGPTDAMAREGET